MKLIFRYIKPLALLTLATLLIKLLGSLMELSIPMIFDFIVSDIVPLKSVPKVLLWGGVMVLAALLTMVLNIIANRMASKVSRNVAEHVRHDLFAKITSLSGAEVDRFGVPSLESRLTSDTYNIHNVVGSTLRIGVRAPIFFIGSIICAFILDPPLTLVMLASTPFIGIVILYITKHGVPLYTKVQSNVDGITRVVREDVQGIRVIKALSKGDYERRRFDRANRELVNSERRAGVAMALSNPALNIILNFGMVAVIVVGAIRVANGDMHPATIIAFTQYFTHMSNAMMSISRVFTRLTKGGASGDRIDEVLKTESDLTVETSKDYPDRKDTPFITFDNVSFSYNKTKNNLDSISFGLKKGETLGIIGATGSGKTTLIQLLMRFYDPDSGNIYIDGKNVRTMSPEELHSKFGAVMQNDFLFAETVRENIDFGRVLSDEQIRTAASAAQAAPFIEAFDEGYEHMLTSKGTNVSGGQKQRILISRALAGKPEILILDDSSSALDYKTDANLRRAIRELLSDTTTIVVAQRVSSIMMSDHILVLDEGRIIGSGTHEELLSSCSVYKEISDSQLGGAILE